MKQNWKVVWWRRQNDDSSLVREVYGRRYAAAAWRLWWRLYYTPHALEVELWRGRVQIMRVGAERWLEVAD